MERGEKEEYVDGFWLSKGGRMEPPELAPSPAAELFRWLHGGPLPITTTGMSSWEWIQQICTFWGCSGRRGVTPAELRRVTVGGGDRRVKLRFDPPTFEEDAIVSPSFLYLQLSHPEGFQTYVLNPELSKSFKSFIYLNLISKIIYFNFKNCF